MDFIGHLSLDSLFGFITGLGGAIVGGFCTVYAADKAVKQENAKELRRDEKEVINMLFSIEAELSALWEFHQRRIGTMIEAMPDGQALEFYYPLTQDYFTVYNSNASLLGRVKDDNVRKSIVVCYNKCKKVVDGFKYNNELFREYRDLVNLAEESPELKGRMAAKYKELQDYAQFIKEDHFELKVYVEQMLKLLAHEFSRKVAV